MTDNVFTPEEVVRLNMRQRDGHYHPYTCGNRGEDDHPVLFGDSGVLVATVRGWICPFCNYTQGWAHEFSKR